MSTALFTRFSLPEGLEELVEGLAREVIKSQCAEPYDIYQLAWTHFSDLVGRRKNIKNAVPYVQPGGRRRRTSGPKQEQQGGRGRGRAAGATRVAAGGPDRKDGGKSHILVRASSLEREGREGREGRVPRRQDKMKKTVSLDRRPFPGAAATRPAEDRPREKLPPPSFRKRTKKEPKAKKTEGQGVTGAAVAAQLWQG
ncbi:uncharacterized protein LOC123505706 [Portunus trituberculatus]|uniref:uncharacterized protein LOC123505706 n=1 Tax=Portunus trituberculatus TaxID=210409 RepID=UPI001E1CBF26|nr:uncharacterized protein LOC123505706 [Portunus trituberculatus]